MLNIVPCQEATRLASEAMERRLSPKEQFDLRLHLFVCELCVRFVRQTKSLRRLLRAYAGRLPPSSVPDVQRLPASVKEQMKTRLG